MYCTARAPEGNDAASTRNVVELNKRGQGGSAKSSY